jgi:hypothetical protein
MVAVIAAYRLQRRLPTEGLQTIILFQSHQPVQARDFVFTRYAP